MCSTGIMPVYRPSWKFTFSVERCFFSCVYWILYENEFIMWCNSLKNMGLCDLVEALNTYLLPVNLWLTVPTVHNNPVHDLLVSMYRQQNRSHKQCCSIKSDITTIKQWLNNVSEFSQIYVYKYFSHISSLTLVWSPSWFAEHLIRWTGGYIKIN
jgi:hypothetical protein